MNDLEFTYNTNGFLSLKVELLHRNNDFLNGKISNPKWVVRIDNSDTHWSVTERNDVEEVYYDLELHGEAVKMFEFEEHGIGYLPNLFSIYDYITEQGINFQKKIY